MWACVVAVVLGGAPASRFPVGLPLVSFGGFGFWSDVAAAGPWRLQRHAVYGAYRVAHEDGRSPVCGDEARCRAELAKRAPPAARARHVVVAIHGAQRQRGAMRSLAKQVARAGMTPVTFEYASAHLAIEDSAACLARFLESLAAERIDFVCHSMGGLVLRQCLATRPEPRCQRVVMLGVPNGGADEADFYCRCPLFQFLFGPAGVQLTTGPLGIASKLPKRLPEKIEVALVAGVLTVPLSWFDDRRWLAMQDGVVTVACNNLDGAVDHGLFVSTHGGLLHQRYIAQATVAFLQSGVLLPQVGRRRDFERCLE